MITQILRDSEVVEDRLNAFSNIYQSADRILSGEDRLRIVCEEAGAWRAVAWTDGTTITINKSFINDVDARSTERMYGINFHELAHVLYTPRRGTTLISWVVERDLQREFNILEDQRIETMLTAVYPSTAPWLTTAVLRWVLGSNCEDTGYVMVRGRKYLPGKLRGALRASFSKQELLPEIDRIIDAYRKLVFPADYDQARLLIEDFAELMQQAGCQPKNDPHGHGYREVEVLANGRPKGVNDQREAASRVKDGEPEELPAAGPSHDSDSDSEGDDDDSDVAVESPEDAQGDSDSGGLGGDDASPSNSGGASETTSAKDTSAKGSSTSDSESSIKDIAESLLEDVLSDVDVIKDINRTLRQVNGTSGDSIKVAKYTHMDPVPSYANQQRVMIRELNRILQAADPGWHRREASGRINATRWIMEGDIDTAYDRWDEGVNDAADLEVVILLDESGSMHTVYEDASNGMWVVKRALDSIGASTTVITFSDDSRVLYHRKDKANYQVRSSFDAAGTDPSDGLTQAASIFHSSSKSQKILIIFSDGDWEWKGQNVVPADVTVDRIAKSGVVTAFGYINSQGRDAETLAKSLREDRKGSLRHNCSITSVLSVRELVPFMSTIITESINGRLSRRNN